jgi:hypothetical protein
MAWLQLNAMCSAALASVSAMLILRIMKVNRLNEGRRISTWPVVNSVRECGCGLKSSVSCLYSGCGCVSSRVVMRK